MDNLPNRLRQSAQGQHDDLSVAKKAADEMKRLRKFIAVLGGCPDCFTVPKHHIDEPFSSCECGTGEDYGDRPAQKVQLAKASEGKCERCGIRLHGWVGPTDCRMPGPQCPHFGMGEQPGWTTHNSYEPPGDLAPARLVYLECEMPAGLYCVDEVNWEPGLRYRLALSEDG